MTFRHALILMIVTLPLLAFQPQCDTNLVRTYGFGAVTLSLNADATFHYLNLVDPANMIDVTGSWNSDSNHVYLSDFDGNRNVPKRWKIDDDCDCLRSSPTNFQIIRICASQRKS